MGRKGHSHRNQHRRRQNSKNQNKYQSKSARAADNSVVADEDLGLQIGGTRARQARQDARRTPSQQKPYQGPRPAKVKKGRVRAEQIRAISQEIFGGTYYCVGRSNGSEVHQDRSR